MDIYFLDLNNFSENKLDSFAHSNKISRNYTSDLKKKQHIAGRYLLHYVLKNFYNTTDFEIEILNDKPILKNSDLHFSISHSKNLVGIAISQEPVGFDIEFNKKKRDFEKLLSRYDIELELESEQLQKKFYEFWTKHEAKIKLNTKNSAPIILTGSINEDFTYSVAGEKTFVIYNISIINE